MKKFFLILLLVIILAVAGVLALIMRSFNPTAYQNQVVESIQKLTGREFSVSGETTVTWNPVPTIVMQDVRLANIDKSSRPTMLSIEKIKVEIAWESLLKSPLVIKSVELTRPKLILERLESNRANFAFPFLMESNLQATEANAFDNGNATKIDTIKIKEGTVEYINQVTKKSLTVSEIDGQIRVDSIKGPFGLKGVGSVDNHQYALDLKTGLFQLDSPVDVAFNIKEETAGMNLALEGQLTPAKIDKWFEGAGDFSIQKPVVACQLLHLPLPYEGMVDKAISGSVALELTPTTEAIKNIVIQVADGADITKVGGAILQTVIGDNVSYQVNLTMDTFKPEQWANYWKKLNWNWFKGEEQKSPVNFNVTFKEMPYRNSKITDIALEGKYENKALTLSKGTMTLPGKTVVAFKGTGSAVKEMPMMDIAGDITSQNAQAAVEAFWPEAAQWLWLKDKAASGKVRLAWTPEQIGLSVKNLTANQTSLNGMIRRNSVAPVYETKLTIKNINLDDYFGWKKAEKPVELSAIPSIIKGFLENKKEWMGASVRANITCQDVTLLGMPMGQFILDGELNDGVLKIGDLKARDVAAANLAFSGIISGVGKGQLGVDALTVNIEAKQLPLLLQKAGIMTTLPLIQKATDATIMAVLKGDQTGTWAGRVQANISDASIKLDGTVEAVDTNPTMKEVSFEIGHPHFKNFMALIKPDYKLFPNLDGIFKTKGIISGSAKTFKIHDLTFGVGLQQLSGLFSFDNQKIKTMVAEISSPAVDLERFTSGSSVIYAPMSGFSKQKIDLSALNDWNLDLKLKAGQLSYKDIAIKGAELQTTVQNKELSLVKLTGISGTSDQSPVQMSGKLDWNTVPTLSTAFEMKNSPLRSDFMVLPDIAFGGGTISVTGDLKARGATPAEMAQSLNGQGTISMVGGQIIGADIEQMIPIITRAVQRNEGPKIYEPEFKRVLHSGKTLVKSWSGDYTIANGVMRLMDMTLKTNNATANPTQVVWEIPKRTMEVSIPVVLNPLNTLPPFVMGISVVGNKGTYQPTFTDLSAALNNQSQTALVENMRQQEEKAQMEIAQKRSDRVTQSKQLTIEARKAMEQMDQKLKEFPFEKGKRLAQSARDALSVVNQLAVREEPTDAQLIQQIEQARLVLIKLDEFNKALDQESLFGAQTSIKEYLEKGTQMVMAMKQAAANYPDVVILVKLADNAEQNMAIINQAAGLLKPTLTPQETEKLMAKCAEAYGKIEKAYQHIQRFDLSATGAAPVKTSVRGSLHRAQ